MNRHAIRDFCARHPYALRAIGLLLAVAAIMVFALFSEVEITPAATDDGSYTFNVVRTAPEVAARCLVSFLVGLISLSTLHLVLADLFRSRVVPRAVTIAAAVLWIAFLAYGFATDATSFVWFASAASQLAALVWAPCVALFGAAAWLRGKGRRAAVVILRILAGMGTATGLALVLFAWFSSAPWQASMETGNPLGPDPDRDIVQSLAWCGWDRWFDMRLYTRRADGDWDAWILRWGFPPRERLVVEFDGNRPKVLAIGAGRYVEPEHPAPDAPEEEGLAVYPGTLTPADLHTLHQSLVHP